MNNILAVPLRGSASWTSGQEPGQWGEVARWRLVERRLLSPARPDAIECLVRLERADGGREPWRAGDLVELRDVLLPSDSAPEPFAAAFSGSRHAAISLLAGGWPAGDWAHVKRATPCLPIASGAGSPTLDLLVFSGCDANPALDRDAIRRLLVETAIDLRIVRSPAHWMPDGPYVFIGDFRAAALARALLQEHRNGELVFLIEAGRGELSLSPQAMLRRDCWRDGTVGVLPKFGSAGELVPLLEAHRRLIRSLLKRGGPIVLAGTAENFLPMARAALGSLLNESVVAALEVEGRLRQIAL